MAAKFKLTEAGGAGKTRKISFQAHEYNVGPDGTFEVDEAHAAAFLRHFGGRLVELPAQKNTAGSDLLNVQLTDEEKEAALDAAADAKGSALSKDEKKDALAQALAAKKAAAGNGG
jgi:hypothetical protein